VSGWHTSSLLPRRSMIAFAFIAFGLLAVGSKVVATQELEALAAGVEDDGTRHERPEPIVQTALEYAEPPLFELTDRAGSTLAHSVRGFALEASPFHLWLVHTPARILDGFERVLGEQIGADLDRQLLRVDEYGWRSVEGLALTRDEAAAISQWVADGGPTLYPNVDPLPGLIVEARLPEPGAPSDQILYGLRWSPLLLLDESVRQRIDRKLDDDRTVSAATWVRALGTGLWKYLEGPRERELALWAQASDEPPTGWEVVPPKTGLAKLLDGVIETPPAWRVSRTVPHWQLIGSSSEWVFERLMPCRYVELCDRLTLEQVDAVRTFLAEEHVGAFQVWLPPTSDRRYPATRFRALGNVGWVDGDVRQRHALFGIQYAAERTLARLELDAPGVNERFERNILVRARSHDQEYYVDHGSGSLPPRVVSTLDLGIQVRLGAALESIESEHDTSLTMGVVVDLDTRDVLALDWRDPYEFGTFAPLQHGFTPGSTFKIITMALALDADLVRPGKLFDVGYGHFLVPGTRRVVGEAEGFATGEITASMCLARSSNAGMVQIGHLVPVETWKQRTLEFGYGRSLPIDLLPPNWQNPAGIIGERASANDRNVWSRTRSHTSVSFGDAMSVNMLQHVTALCALVHDGELRPLRLIEAVEAGARTIELPPSTGETVVRPRTVEQLRAMMSLGATEGTGRRLERPDGLLLETKTGTYEKLERGDVSYHVMGESLRRAREAGEEWKAGAAHREHSGDWGGAKWGYTSSIVVVGEVASGPLAGRRILTYIVAEDPRGEVRFGSEVTGTAAVDVVAYALGYDAADRLRARVHSDGRPRLDAVAIPELEDLEERPWTGVGR
jgi:hypothetical protein